MTLFTRMLFFIFLGTNVLANDISVNYSPKTTNGQNSLEIHIKFISGKTINSVYGGDGVLDYFWISGVTPDKMLLTPQEQNMLMLFLANHKPVQNNNEKLVVKLIEFSANVIPAGELVSPYQKKPDAYHTTGPAWTPICNSFGKMKAAIFTAAGNTVQTQAVVGDPVECSGRCGKNCKQFGQGQDSTQYTQECLNHDMCVKSTGHILGECADEFWLAAPGYLWAPNCF